MAVVNRQSPSTATATVVILLLLQVCLSYGAAGRVSKPHIMYVLVDDWGWANVGYHRDPPTPEVDTPNFDSLMKDGLELDQFYTYQVCSPSRSAFISGRLPIHVNDQNQVIGLYNPNDPVSGFAGIPRNMTGIAEKMKEAGYITHQVGKWDVGGATPEHLPTGRGFETSLGYLNGNNDYYTEIFGNCGETQIVDLWDTDKPATGLNGTGSDNYEEALFTERLFSILDNYTDSSRPLFLYYSPHLVHEPFQVPQRYLDMYKFIDYEARQAYHAMVKYMDDVMGNLTAILKKKGMWDDLLLVVTSDNGGPFSSGNNFPLRGAKSSDWQGGVRVNAFVTGGYLPEAMRGQKTEQYIHISDWYSTFCAIAGIDPTDTKAAKADLPPIDSLNMWPLISGEDATSPREDIPLSYNSLISGDYKIITDSILHSYWTGPQFPNATSTTKSLHADVECGDGCLFNIITDPNEYENIAKKMPDVLKSMQEKLAFYQNTYFNPHRGKLSSLSCDAAMNKYGGFWGPFIS